MMKGIYFTTIVAFITWSSCFKYEDCKPPDNFDMPDKVIYSSFNMESMFRYVVTDSMKLHFEQINNVPPMTSELNSLYKSFIDQAYIQSIDFQDSFKLEAKIYLNGVLSQSFNTTYNKDNQVLYFNAPFPNKNINLYLVSKNYVTIPYVFSFFRKQGQVNIINQISQHESYAFFNQETTVRSVIKANSLQIGDTVYLNKVNLVYHSY